jgi:hypothetical protein
MSNRLICKFLVIKTSHRRAVVGALVRHSISLEATRDRPLTYDLTVPDAAATRLCAARAQANATSGAMPTTQNIYASSRIRFSYRNETEEEE